MYCTLQEAYQVPSFADKKLRKAVGCKKPLAQDDNAGFFTAYNLDNYRKEQAAYQRTNQRSNGTAGNSENSGTINEGFVGTIGTEPTYNSMANDYKYYCDNYRICDTNKKTIEGFENAPSSSSSNGVNMKPKSQEQCGPLQPPPYEFPISDEAKKQYKSAFDIALNQVMPHSPMPTPMRMRQVDMSNVSGYYDEDLEMYLQTKEMKPANIKPPIKAPIENINFDPDSSPIAEAMKDFDGQLKPEITTAGKDVKKNDEKTTPTNVTIIQQSAPNNIDHKSRWIDLLLFFFAGILVIIMCDQLIKLGMMLGVNETINTLKPILERIEKQLEQSKLE